MNLFLFLAGIGLVVVGILWRLMEIQGRGTARAPLNAPGRGAQGRRSSAPEFLPRTPNAVGTNVREAEALHRVIPSATDQSFRRTDRLMLKIPVEVSGTNLESKSFSERTHTQAINRNGASFIIQNSLPPDGQITVKNLQTGQSCRFRACRAIQDLPGGLREWGVECLDPAPNFWGISFPESTHEAYVEEETVGSLLECTTCHCREMAKLPLSEYRTMVQKISSVRHCAWCGAETDWKFAILGEDVDATGPPGLKGQEVAVLRVKGQHEERRIARLPISIKHEDGREEFTIAENVSRAGICCAAKMDLQVGDHVLLWLPSDQGSGEAEFGAQIMWVRKIHEGGKFLYGMKLERDASSTV